jgi:hypothetical protein
MEFLSFALSIARTLKMSQITPQIAPLHANCDFITFLSANQASPSRSAGAAEAGLDPSSPILLVPLMGRIFTGRITIEFSKHSTDNADIASSSM